ALQMPGEPCGPDQPGIAVGHKRRYLSSRTGKWRPGMGAGKGLARAKSHPVCEELSHSDSAQRARARFPRADEPDAGELVWAAATPGPERRDRVGRGEALDIEGRR